MKISKLIKQLKRIRREHGEIIVMSSDDYGIEEPVIGYYEGKGVTNNQYLFIDGYAKDEVVTTVIEPEKHYAVHNGKLYSSNEIYAIFDTLDEALFFEALIAQWAEYLHHLDGEVSTREFYDTVDAVKELTGVGFELTYSVDWEEDCHQRPFIYTFETKDFSGIVNGR